MSAHLWPDHDSRAWERLRIHPFKSIGSLALSEFEAMPSR